MSEKTRLTITAIICLTVVVVLVALAVAFPFARAGAASDEPRWLCGTQLYMSNKPTVALEVYVWREPADAAIARGWTHHRLLLPRRASPMSVARIPATHTSTPTNPVGTT